MTISTLERLFRDAAAIWSLLDAVIISVPALGNVVVGVAPGLSVHVSRSPTHAPSSSCPLIPRIGIRTACLAIFHDRADIRERQLATEFQPIAAYAGVDVWIRGAERRRGPRAARNI
jgi:hypothetical protein